MTPSSISGSQFSLQQLVDQYMQLESIPRNRLIEQKKGLQNTKSIFSDLDSKLSALETKANYFNDSVFNPFAAKLASSSDRDRVEVLAQNSAVNGNHTVSVERLAKSDKRVSDQFADSASDFTSFTSDETFTIEIAHPTDDDGTNRVNVEVTVSGSVFSDTNEVVLDAVADAINNAMSQAVTDETINSDEVVHASVVKEESGVSRLVLGSQQSGYTYRMDFGSSDLLDALNINNNALAEGTTGGYMTEIGTSATDSALNSKFQLDGLTFYRDSNTVDDAVNGLTLKLYDVFSQEETITVETDVEAIREDISQFIKTYNEAIDYLRKHTRVNPDTYDRGALSTELIYSGMLTDLRNLATGEVSTTDSDRYTMLYHIGIETDQEGHLAIEDADKLTAALENDPELVADLFRSDDGVAQRMEGYIENYVKTNGAIDRSKKQIDTKISSLDNRIDYMDDLLAKKEERYFEQFAELQKSMYILQNQQSYFNTFFG